MRRVAIRCGKMERRVSRRVWGSSKSRTWGAGVKERRWTAMLMLTQIRFDATRLGDHVLYCTVR